ncbi:HpcH/HpaI aldolase/citrate lyase family protein [Sphaerotilus mobilis]|uniref:Citrate lyase subunit beta/citryl-CoA lyase n=1 Tax=Sphaerotilus mobilis TaxID=47994 RepID=A0A4Q7LQ46_9BURK|nr:CoA ester lyase [Sphaerotilus mobilis]RZS56926.1 citrate lyase subunit beta/citryl-CoA lyase [Sphaerotilus mobilis]
MSPRSYLFVPGDRPERLAKALASGADAVVLDLEDAVAPTRKAMAREAMFEALSTLAAASDAAGRCVVRINDRSSPHHAEDLAWLARLAQADISLAGVMLPKAESADDIAALRMGIGTLPVLALIESARGVLQAGAIAAAPGVQRLVFGTLDYALDLDLDLDAWPEPLALDAAAATLAQASRSAGLVSPVAGVTVQIDDEAPLQRDLARQRAHGYGAKLCIHPRQIAAVHAALTPDAATLAWARRVLQAIAEAGDQAGVVQLDGRMVDRPVIERARRLLARAPG